ncbi:MAG: hypothetical protein HUU45_01235 [Leptospiraceae bacterium]|nr:hypothetical protein [Leptospiraceae bacterium]
MKKFLLIFLFGFIHYSIFSQIQEFHSVEDGFLRLKASSLQTGKFKLVSPDTGDIIYLIGVIHIGEKSYYEKINVFSKDMDVLFYEGVSFSTQKLSNTKHSILQNIAQVANKQTNFKEILKYQESFAKKVSLARQVDELIPEYNWVNADVNYAEFQNILKKHEISQHKMMNYLSLDNKNTFQNYNEIENMDETNPVFIKKIKEYKKIIASNLVTSANDLCFSEKMKLARKILILERNKVALSFVQKRLNQKNPQIIGMLYGAAHIPDFLNILQKEYGFIIDSHEWLDAWNL